MSSAKNHRKGSLASLDTQIKETEQQLIGRQHCAHIHTDTLVKDLQKEMTSPTTLLLIGGLGFIIGELTKPAPKKVWQAATAADVTGEPQASVTPLKMALDFKDLVLAIYKAVPLLWIMETFHPEWALNRNPASQVKNNQSPSV